MDESKEVLMKVIIGNINWRLVPGEVNSSVLESRVIHSWGQARHYPKLAWLLADDASALVPFTLDAVVFLLTPDELSFVAGASDVVERKFIQYLSKCWADCEIEGSLEAQLLAHHMALKNRKWTRRQGFESCKALGFFLLLSFPTFCDQCRLSLIWCP